MKKHLILAGAIGIAALGLSAQAATVSVTEIKTSGPKAVDSWYSNYDSAAAGTSAIVDLTGGPGTLNSGQPLGPQAVRLTTTSDNADKAVIGTYADFGLASAVLSDVNLMYSYFKTSTTDTTAAPAIKLEIYNPGGTGDNYGQLIFEPYWNTGTGSVPSDSWQSVSINSTTGSGNPSSGGWWWNGGFEVGSGAGGPPLRSLSEWAGIFSAADSDFAGAHVTGLLVGVGSYNPNQTDYFDAVSIKIPASESTSGIDKTYDFTASVPDNGTTFAMLGLTVLAMVGIKTRQRTAAL